MRKQLSNHAVLCADNIALSNVVYEHKRKPNPSGPGNHPEKRSRSSPPCLSLPPESPVAGPSIPFEDDSLRFENDHDVVRILKGVQ